MKIIILMCVLLTLSACQNNEFWKKLENKIDNGNTKIFVRELTNYDWDKVCVLEAYALDIGGRGAQIKEYIPYDLGDFKDNIPHLNSDGQWAFAFIKDGRVVNIEKKGRPMYLRADYKNNCLSNDGAIFTQKGEYLYISDKPRKDEISSVKAIAKYPEWNLSQLTKDQRIKKINTFIKPYSYNLYHGTAVNVKYSASETKECYKIFDKVKRISSDDVLDPVFVTSSLDYPKVVSVFQGCKNLEPYKEYYPSKDAWFNKNHISYEYAYYLLASNNMEFYDFKEGNVWGFFAEGGRFHCKKSNVQDCSNMIGYAGVSKIINTESCEVLNLGMPTSRMKPNSKSIGGERTINHNSTYNFYAFVKIDEQIYQVSFKTDAVPKKECLKGKKTCAMTESGTYLYLTKVPNLSRTDKIQTSCVFKPNIPKKEKQ